MPPLILSCHHQDAIPDDAPINIISQTLRTFHATHKVTYSFNAQLLRNLEEQPVDDIGIEWDAKKYPFEQIATLEFEPQDSWLPGFRTWWDDRITLNSWHGLTVCSFLSSLCVRLCVLEGGKSVMSTARQDDGRTGTSGETKVGSAR